MHYLPRVVVALSLIVASIATEDLGPVPTCPFLSNTITFYPVDNDCARYWECHAGFRYIMSCPAGLYWNTNLNTCDYQQNVNCGASTRDPQCPYPSNEITYLSDGSDSTKYYTCYDGYKTEASCPAGLSWNQILKACDYAENIGTRDPQCPYPSNEITYLSDGSDSTKYYTCYDGYKTEASCPAGLSWNQILKACDYAENIGTRDPQCPYPSNEITYLSDGSDATKYYTCYDGYKTEASCPAGLSWNQILKACDYAENIGTRDPQCPYPSKEITYLSDGSDATKYYTCYDGYKTEASCPAGLSWNQILKACDYAENIGTRDPQCPYPSNEITYLSDGSDSTKFYTCFDGYKTETSCPAGLSWNQILKACDYAENIGTRDPQCPYPSNKITYLSDGSDSTKYYTCYDGYKTEASCPAGLSWNQILKACDYAENIGKRDPQCPYPSNEITYLSDGSDSTKFYTCYDGYKTETSCPAGLSWNQILKVCDYAENIGTRDPQCPYPSNEITYLSDGSDSTKYYTCYDGYKTETSCPAGLSWNQILTVCDYPENIGYSCAGKQYGPYLTDPSDCSKFYTCIESKAIVVKCPEGLLFNEAINTCDYPEHVQCGQK